MYARTEGIETKATAKLTKLIETNVEHVDFDAVWKSE
jgi:hypothetical protein